MNSSSQGFAKCADAGPNSPRSPHALYLSARDDGWRPSGVRMGRGWEPCSMSVESARRYLGSWTRDSEVVECVAWFDHDDGLKLIVADFAGGRRVIVRVLSNTTKITFSRWVEAAPKASPQGTEGESPKSREEQQPSDSGRAQGNGG